jgi:hypothetical protein
MASATDMEVRVSSVRINHVYSLHVGSSLALYLSFVQTGQSTLASSGMTTMYVLPCHQWPRIEYVSGPHETPSGAF